MVNLGYSDSIWIREYFGNADEYYMISMQKYSVILFRRVFIWILEPEVSQMVI